MTPRQRLEIEQSEKRQRVNELLSAGELDDTQRVELDSLTKRLVELEPELRAAILVEPDPYMSPASDNGDRERVELRSKVSVGEVSGGCHARAFGGRSGAGTPGRGGT